LPDIYHDACKAGAQVGKLHTTLMGGHSSLLDNDGWPPKSLARLMARWQERVLKTETLNVGNDHGR
jgi:hypothetical protein